jgi:hypothetical protein
MEKASHLQYLRAKYIELNQQFLRELQTGKSLATLKDVNVVMNTLLQEMEALEQNIKAEDDDQVKA